MTAYYPHQRVQHSTMISHAKPRPGVWARITGALAARLQNARMRRELNGMTGAELRDIGITRADIPRVFGPDFGREYSRRGRD